MYIEAAIALAVVAVLAYAVLRKRKPKGNAPLRDTPPRREP